MFCLRYLFLAGLVIALSWRQVAFGVGETAAGGPFWDWRGFGPGWGVGRHAASSDASVRCFLAALSLWGRLDRLGLCD